MGNPILKNISGTLVGTSPPQKKSHDMQHLAELGRLSATLLHEISNPLTAALLHLDQFKSRDNPAIREARRSIRLLKRYVEAARQQVRQESEMVPFSLTSQFRQIKRVVGPMAISSGVHLMIEPLPNCRIYGDPVKFQQIMANLMVNAIEAYIDDSAPGLIKPVRVSFTRSGQSVSINVIDWGQGIDAGKLGRVFEPFYTTKSHTGHGLGMGLAIVRQYVVNDFAGSIVVTSTSRKGTVFTIKLPMLPT